MPSSVVDACPGSTRNAMESKAPCAVILITAVMGHTAVSPIQASQFSDPLELATWNQKELL